MYKFSFPKIKLAMAFLSLFVLIAMVQDTYSKYTSSASGDATVPVARWQITVNNQDIISNNFLTNVISPYTIQNSHIKDGVIAPTSVGYFDLVLDYTNVDTSFEYLITSSVPLTSGVPDIKITGYSEDGGTMIPLTSENTDIGSTILLTDTTRTKTIRVFFTWDDSEDAIMTNEDDTNATLTNSQALINIMINFKQVVS